MSSFIVDMEGRFRLIKKFPFLVPHYYAVGQKLSSATGIEKVIPLDKHHRLDVPLHPQQTIVQFNSTYLETVDRNERRRGDAVGWGILTTLLTSQFIMLLILIISKTIESFHLFAFITMIFVLICIIIVIMLLINVLSTELFTFQYYPIRFNRKNKKVYVRQYNRKVEVYDWDELHFFITHIKEDKDIRGITFAEDGETITGMFALPFFANISDNNLKSHFEFFRRYMEGSDNDLKEVKDAIRYIYPIHQKRETPLMSFNRLKLGFHLPSFNMEYPEKSFEFLPVYIIVLPVIWLRYIGRVISMLTSFRHRFPADIEAECQIDPNDPNDLNKYLPEGNLEQRHQPLWKTLLFSIFIVISTIIMLFIGAFIIDMMGAVRPHGDYPSMVDKLWYVISLGWLG